MWFINDHRLCIAILALTRVIYKRVTVEAADAVTIAREAAKGKRAGVRLVVLCALWSHIMFAEVGASKVCTFLRRQENSNWTFTVTNM